jgi:hypothetical protein
MISGSFNPGAVVRRDEENYNLFGRLFTMRIGVMPGVRGRTAGIQLRP